MAEVLKEVKLAEVVGKRSGGVIRLLKVDDGYEVYFLECHPTDIFKGRTLRKAYKTLSRAEGYYELLCHRYPLAD